MSHDTQPTPDFPPQPVPKRNRTNVIIIGSALAVIAAIIGTGVVVANTGDDDGGTQASSVTKASASVSATPSPTPTPSQETFRFGDTADINSGGFNFTATVLAYKDTGIAGIPGVLKPGQKWAAVEVKVCNTGTDAFSVSAFVWSLAYADGARFDPTHMSGGEFPQPLYPAEARVKAGDCVRGNVLFEVPESGRAERVLYSPQDLVEPAEWQVGKG